jgi:hypothetical protein
MADDDLDEQEEGTVPRSHIRQLEEQARRAKDLEAQVAQLQRENAFAQALGGADHPGLKYFKQGYDGELTADAIRQAASEAGFLASQSQPSVEQAFSQAQTGPDPALIDRFNSASQGAQPPVKQGWQEALAEADRIQDEQARQDAILSVVERFGGHTSRSAQ